MTIDLTSATKFVNDLPEGLVKGWLLLYLAEKMDDEHRPDFMAALEVQYGEAPLMANRFLMEHLSTMDQSTSYIDRLMKHGALYLKDPFNQDLNTLKGSLLAALGCHDPHFQTLLDVKHDSKRLDDLLMVNCTLLLLVWNTHQNEREAIRPTIINQLLTSTVAKFPFYLSE